MKRRFVPNGITSCNLICGCIATGSAFVGHMNTAFFFILLGAFFDFFDGFSSRLLKVPSKMGIELDSLADCVTFGVAPAAMIFNLFTKVRYPELMYNPMCFRLLPFTAFLLAAFSAYRLAKFNLDERQHTSFLGLPTPACAIFWGALISSSWSYLVGPRFNAVFLFAFMIMFCFLLVSEIPMFALKFTTYAWRNKTNIVRYSFLIICTVLLVACAIVAPKGACWQYVSRGIAGCIGLYIVSNIGLYFQKLKDE